MPNNAAAEKPGSSEHGDDAMVHGGHGLDLVSSCQLTQTARLLTAIYHLGYLVASNVVLLASAATAGTDNLILTRRGGHIRHAVEPRIPFN